MPRSAFSHWLVGLHRLAGMRRGRLAALIALGVPIWLSILSVPEVLPMGLDQSWQAALARFFKTRAQAGIDYIFTCGPLGFFYTTGFDADLYWHKYAWELAVKLGFATLLVRLIWQLPGMASRIALFLISALYLGIDPHQPREVLYGLFVSDALYLFMLLLMGAWLIDTSSPFVATALGLGFGALALVKFTFLLFAVLCVVLAGVYHLATSWAKARQGTEAGGTNNQSMQNRLALAPATGFLAGWGFAWLALGQSLANIPVYLRGSWEIASGYTGAMALAGDATQVAVALGILTVVIGQLSLLDWTASGRRHTIGMTALVVPALFLQWKHGFTRQDEHAFSFFTFTLLVPFLLLKLTSPTKRRLIAGYALATCAVLVGILGIHLCMGTRWDPDYGAEEWYTRIRVHGAYVAAPGRALERLVSTRVNGAEHYQLRYIPGVVGSAPVDLLFSVPSILLLNGLNWDPRPVFQSYSAYTPYLLSANARFFRSKQAPAFVDMAFGAIDDHYPPLEDCLALREIFRHYVPDLEERACILLRKAPAVPPPVAEGPILMERIIRFGETLRLDHEEAFYQTLALRFHPTAWGSLRAFLFRPPSLWMELHTADDANFRYRVIPAPAAEGFLINPFLGNFDDLLKVYGKPGAGRVQTVRFSVDGDASCYADRIDILLRAEPGLVSYRVKISERH